MSRKKTKHFYSHLVETTDITIELAEMDLSPNERIHLISLVDANIHSVVVSKVLQNLEEEDKKIFLKNCILKELKKNQIKSLHFFMKKLFHG